MRRTLLISLLATQLTGCPSVMNANIKNESASLLVISRPDGGYSWDINPGSEAKTPWYEGCNIIITDQDKKYYAGRFSVLPELVKPHIFSVSTELTYRDNELFFATSSDQLIPVPKAAKCGWPN